MIKDGKIFGKINIVDFFVILIILLLICAAVFKFGKFNVKTEESTTQTIMYKIEVKNIREYTIDAIQSGDVVYDSQTGNNIGVVRNVEKITAKSNSELVTGEVITVDNPYRYNMIITIETPGTVEANAYYANRTIELKVDSEKTIETKYVKTTGLISDIQIVAKVSEDSIKLEDSN